MANVADSIPTDVNFRCTGCGKCCNGPPQLSVREIFNHLDDFVMDASVICQPLKAPDHSHRKFDPRHTRFAQLTSDQAVGLGGLIKTSEGGIFGFTQVAVTLAASVLSYPHKAICPALLPDKRCGIYDNRPETCRYIPGQHLIPSAHQHLAVDMFRTSLGDDTCDWSSTAPALIRGGVVVNPEMKASLDAAEDDQRHDGHLLRLLLDADLELPEFEDQILSMSFFLDQCLLDGEALIPLVLFTVFLHNLKRLGMLPERYEIPSIKEVALRQADLCERMIEINIREKDRAAREHTEMLRRSLKLNQVTAANF